MTRTSLSTTLLLCILFGTGCSRPSNPALPIASASPRTGAALLQEATSLEGPEVVTVDAGTGRRFTSVLPPTFRDGNGTYVGVNPDESILVQLSVSGTTAEDLQQYREIPRLDSFEELSIGKWQTIVAHDSAPDRWVARAVLQDPFIASGMYHVIECLSAHATLNSFWDGCRTMIENASVDQAMVD
jgi:hypothetical protein